MAATHNWENHLDKVNPEDDEVKIVVVGESAIGKTCMVSCYIKDEFPD